MDNNKKKQETVIISMVILILVGFLGSYAYFINIPNAKNQEVSVETGNLSLIFEDGNNGINEALNFGSSITKTFTIENNGSLDATAVMYFDNLINTYTLGSLTYTLSYSESEDGEYQDLVTNHNVPRSEDNTSRILAAKLFIPPNQKYYYKLTITLNYLSDVDQTADLSAIFTSNFKLEETGNGALDTLKSLGLKVKKGSPDFALTATTDETKDGLYSMDDDYGTSYYYRGAVVNNYVRFAGFYWRIIRINGDGSLRVQYDGTKAHANGDSSTNRSAIQGATFNSSGDAKYLGYMYSPAGSTLSASKEQAQTNEVDSNAKTLLDNWYKTNIEDQGFSKYISDTLFCNDRMTNDVPYIWYSWDTTLGYGKNGTYYSHGFNVQGLNNPSLLCSQQNDRFTSRDVDIGNGDLKYPVGLITADEIMMAGSGKYGTANNKYYLYKGHSHWSMTPVDLYYSNACPDVTYVNSNGSLYAYGGSTNSQGLAPVINLDSEYASTMLGTGTMTDPYVLDTPEEREKLALQKKNKESLQKTISKLNITAKDSKPTFTSQATTNEGIYMMEDDYGISYYYRGTVENNYVKFAGFFWRILRINGDGSMRIVYDGTEAYQNGVSNLDRVAIQKIKYNETTNDAKYNGFMYSPIGTTASISKVEAETNKESSTIKTELDKWYEENILNKNLSSYVSDSIFCNDRTLEDSGLGYGTNYTLYAGRGRYRGTWRGQPTLKCPNKNDAFTVSDTKFGNGVLTYPIGLMTKDEDIVAGSGNSKNTKYYLYKGYQYWTMTPDSYTSCANIMPGNSWTNYNCSNSSNIHVVPVINLTPEYIQQMVGDGTIGNEYRVE